MRSNHAASTALILSMSLSACGPDPAQAPPSTPEARATVGVVAHDAAAIAHSAASPSTSPAQLTLWAKHPSPIVREAVAANPKTPVDVLLALREPGQATPIHRRLAMNPSMPMATVLSMRAAGEVGDVSLAANPLLPVDVMRDIVRRGDALALATLQQNPALPAELKQAITTSARQP
jgi:hypothetical protein